MQKNTSKTPSPLLNKKKQRKKEKQKERKGKQGQQLLKVQLIAEEIVDKQHALHFYIC